MDGDLPRVLGERICAAWGLDPALVLSVDVHWRPSELPTATVVLLATEGLALELLTLAPVARSVEALSDG